MLSLLTHIHSRGFPASVNFSFNPPLPVTLSLLRLAFQNESIETQGSRGEDNDDSKALEPVGGE